MIYFEQGSVHARLEDRDIQRGLSAALEKIGPRKKVLAIPPDMTRYHSMAGKITQMVWDHYGSGLSDVLPALVFRFCGG